MTSSRPEPGVVWRNCVCSEVRYLKEYMEGFNVERTLTDFRGVDGFERFLSSKHFRRGPHDMSYCTGNRNERASGCVKVEKLEEGIGIGAGHY